MSDSKKRKSTNSKAKDDQKKKVEAVLEESSDEEVGPKVQRVGYVEMKAKGGFKAIYAVLIEGSFYWMKTSTVRHFHCCRGRGDHGSRHLASRPDDCPNPFHRTQKTPPLSPPLPRFPPPCPSMPRVSFLLLTPADELASLFHTSLQYVPPTFSFTLQDPEPKGSVDLKGYKITSEKAEKKKKHLFHITKDGEVRTKNPEGGITYLISTRTNQYSLVP